MNIILLFAAILSLNGEWKLDYWHETPGRPVRELASVPKDAKSVKASVPGNCELDLVNAGVLPAMEVGMNVRTLRKYEDRGWLYTKTFNFDSSTSASTVIRFDGVDTLADYFLNGVKIGESENMLIPHEFDVTDVIRNGENKLQVLIRSAFYEAQKYSIGELGYQMDFGDNEPLRKAAYQGGWDIFPRIYCAGIWRGVTVKSVPSVKIDNVAWVFGNFNKDFTRCQARAMFRVSGIADAFRWGCKLRASVGDFKVEREYVAVQNLMDLILVNPKLWWPKGMGEPNLYEAKIEVVDPNGKVLASDTRKVGVRLIQLERDDVYSAERPGQFLFRVNGEPCYIRGSNWVPVDAFPSRQRDRIIPTLEMFEDLNCNMVRVWGGGVYEPDEFFDWCDAHGLMVWQDFMTGCAVFPQDDRYAKLTETEIRDVVLRLRNHPSIALWAGNNENDNSFTWKPLAEFHRDGNTERSSRQTIPRVLYEFDISRPYLPSSPYEPPDVVSGLAKASEMHLWGAREYYKTPFYTNSPCWFASEMGYHGCPNRESLEQMMTKDCVYPWKGEVAKFEKNHKLLDWNDEWRLKASNPFMKGSSGLWKRNDLMTNQIRLMFGGVDTDFDTFIEQSQFIQSEAMKTFCELFRSGKFVKKNGLIWWNVRDGWPQLSDAVVDYYGGKKRAYFALKNAQQTQIVCVTDDHHVWAVNDALREIKGKVKITDAESGKTLMEKSFTIPRNERLDLGTIDWKGRGAVLISADFEGREFKNHFLYGEPPFDWKKVKEWMK